MRVTNPRRHTRARPCGRRLARPPKRPAFAKSPRPSGVSFRCNTKLRYTTMILLPDERGDPRRRVRRQRLLGDLRHAEHRARQARQGRRGDEPQSGHGQRRGLFLPADGKQEGQPDLKIYVTADRRRRGTSRSTYSATQVTALQTELTEARAAVESVRHRTRGSRRDASDSNIRPRCSSPTARPSTRSRSSSVPSGTTASSPISSPTPRSCRAVRGEGRSTLARELPSAERHVRRAEGARARLSRARQGPLFVPARTVGHGRR